MAARANYNFNHIALSVPDGQAAVDWYTSLFGFKVVVPLATVKASEAAGPFMAAIYGEEFEEVKLAILSAGNGVGFEIFEFVKPRYSGPAEREDWNPKTYTRGGAFHFSLTVHDVDKVADEAIRKGAKQVGERTQPQTNEKAVYLQDPWGNVVELLSTSFDLLFQLMFRSQGENSALIG